MGEDDKPDDKAKPAPKVPEVPPWLPLPDNFKDFLACKRDSLQLGGDEQKTALKDVTVKFTPDPKRKRHFTITIKGVTAAGGAGLPDPLELDASVDADGNLRIHTDGRDDIPKPVKKALREFVQGFNKFLKGKGKKLGDLETKDGKLVLSKVASTAMNILPTWEKVGAGALIALVTVGGVAGMNIGDSTTTRTVDSPSAVADDNNGRSEATDALLVLNGGYCIHHARTSEIELQFTVPSSLNGHRIDARYAKGPRGGAATGQGVVEDGFVSIPVDVTGRGPGEYRGFALRDSKLKLDLRYEYDPPDPAFVTPEETFCPGKSVLVGDMPWIGAFAAGADHNPGRKYTNPTTGLPLMTPSAWLNCLTVNGAPFGSWVMFTGESADGRKVEGTGALDANGHALVASGITSFGSYRGLSAEVVDPVDSSLRWKLDLPPLLGEPYPINGPETPCNPSALPPGILRGEESSEPTQSAEPKPDSAANPVSNTVTEETDALPWSLVVAAGLDIAVLGALFREKVRRQGPADHLPPLFGDDPEEEAKYREGWHRQHGYAPVIDNPPDDPPAVM